MMTPWFPVGVYPAYDGVYPARCAAGGGASTCWFLLRWHGGTQRWYSAGSDGASGWNVIGGAGNNNRDKYQWRGLAQRHAEVDMDHLGLVRKCLRQSFPAIRGASEEVGRR